MLFVSAIGDWLYIVGILVGSLLLPVLIATAGPWPALPILGGLMLVAGAVAIVLIGPAATRPASPFEAILTRVARLPLFTGVGSSALERALGRLVETPVVAGQAVVTKGEAADRYSSSSRARLS